MDNKDTNQLDHDLLIELRTEMRGLRDEVRKLNDGNSEKIQDHEKRLRAIEKYVWGAIGAIGIIEFIIGAYVAFHK